MTNGEKIKEIFPNSHIDERSHTVFVGYEAMSFRRDWWNAEYKELTTKNDSEVDCVSRQFMYDLGATCIAYRNDKQELIPIISIDELPSVTPQEPRWIPVSERLPESNRLVLCYITTGATETYFLALWNDTLNAWEEGIGGYRLLENDLGYEVIAWMPLPTAYREVEE